MVNIDVTNANVASANLSTSGTLYEGRVGLVIDGHNIARQFLMVQRFQTSLTAYLYNWGALGTPSAPTTWAPVVSSSLSLGYYTIPIALYNNKTSDSYTLVARLRTSSSPTYYSINIISINKSTLAMSIIATISPNAVESYNAVLFANQMKVTPDGRWYYIDYYTDGSNYYRIYEINMANQTYSYTDTSVAYGGACNYCLGDANNIIRVAEHDVVREINLTTGALDNTYTVTGFNPSYKAEYFQLHKNFIAGPISSSAVMIKNFLTDEKVLESTDLLATKRAITFIFDGKTVLGPTKLFNLKTVTTLDFILPPTYPDNDAVLPCNPVRYFGESSNTDKVFLSIILVETPRIHVVTINTNQE